jgi:outer membrane protein assembly factor BamA
MSRAKSAAWLVCGLFGVVAFGGSVRADWKAANFPPPTVNEIVFMGAEHFSADELQRHTNLAEGMTFDTAKVADDCAAIVRHYQEHGYPFATCSQKLELDFVRHPSGQPALGGPWHWQLIYTITEGPKVKVSHVEFIGNTFVGADVLAGQLQSHKRGSSRTNFAQVPDDVIRLTEYYRSFGYLDVEVSYELQWNLDGGDATMVFRIHEGERHK